MKYVISDIHGDMESFYKLLIKTNFSRSDQLYVLGDAIDKGEDNLCVYSFIRDAENIYHIKGNHEFLLERYMRGEINKNLYDACGGYNTRIEMEALPEEKKRILLAYLEKLPIYEEVYLNGMTYFLTHSGYQADYCVQHKESGVVDIKASVDQALEADQEGYLFSNDIHHLPASIEFDKRIVVGHYPTTYVMQWLMARIYHGKHCIDIDTGNEFREDGGKLACLRLDDGTEYYV